MSIVSTNFLLARMAAFVLIMLTSTIAAVASGMFLGFNEVAMFIVGISLSAFLGAFNVFEPKAVDMEYNKIKKLVENFRSNDE